MEERLSSLFPLGVIVMLAVFLGGRKIASMRIADLFSTYKSYRLFPSARNKAEAVSTSDTQMIEVSKESDFPEGWWTSEKQFALEQRVIFSKVNIGADFGSFIIHRTSLTST